VVDGTAPLVGGRGRYGAAQEFDQELLAPLLRPGLRRLLLVRLEDSQSAALGLGP
jgi:hypothetical protein